MLEREANAAASAQTNRSSSYNSGSQGLRNVPKLPIFREDKDDMDAFLFRFEAHAEMCKWDRNVWSIHFAACLQGVPLSFYHSLCAGGPISYDDMKTHFLKKFLCSEEGFRERFRSSKPEVGESFILFLLRVRHYFDRWIDLSEVTKDFAGIVDLLLREQILQSCSKDLAVFLKERKFTEVNKLCESAELYREAHPGKSLARQKDGSMFSANVGFSQNVPSQLSSQWSRGNRNDGPQRGYPVQSGFRPPQSSFHGGRGTSFPQQASGSRFTVSNQSGSRGSTRSRGVRRGFSRSVSHTDVCRKCGGVGHWSTTCTSLDGKLQTAGSCKVLLSSQVEHSIGQLTLLSGFVGKQKATVLRDTGCTTAGVKRSLVRDDQFTGEKQRCVTFGGLIEVFPLADIIVDTPFFAGQITCCVIDSPVADLILGNLPGVSNVPHVNQEGSENAVGLVTTRLQEHKLNQASIPLVTAVPHELTVNREKLIQLQGEDDTLVKLFQKEKDKTVVNSGSARVSFFFFFEGVLYRHFRDGEVLTEQIVVPSSLRSSVLCAAHDGIMAGHCGVRRTLQRVLLRFFWPGVRNGVAKYCQTCDVCQKTVSKGKVHPIALAKMPVVEVPFQKIAVDLIGPFSPTSNNGFRWVLTVMDVATRYPEAIPLRKIDTVSVAEALMVVFSRVGYPEEILSDCGSQFISDLMKEIYRLLSIRSIHTSPYHAQANGLVERFNGTLKTMLKKVVQSHPENWDRYLPALLFAYRELPCESTGFSPFELVFGRRPRGPMDVLAQVWSDDKQREDAKPLYQYVSDLKTVLSESISVAHENLAKSSDRYKHFHDLKSVPRSFQVGDEVLVLLPSDSNRLLMSWKGPFPVVKSYGTDYKIQMGKKLKVFHANMLQRYFRRSEHVGVSVVADVQDESVSQEEVGMGAFPFSDVVQAEFSRREEETQFTSVGVVQAELDDGVILPTIPSIQGETTENIRIDAGLSPSRQKDLKAVFSDFKEVFTDKPGVAKTDVVHVIRVTSEVPIRLKPYPLPFASKQIVEDEVRSMLELGVIERSQSPYSSPIVLVKKPDGSTRFCIDFRALNKVTVFDAEPIPNVESLFCQLSGAHFFTKIDLSKGYWQILVKEEDRPKTAFQTPQGLFQWVRMPFGLVTAPATFARMMRCLCLETYSACNFFDDVLIGSEVWEDHLVHIRGVLRKLVDFGLTVRPSKLYAGFQELEFLGHVVSHGLLKPQQNKIKKILSIVRPGTKKQVRSLLGLVGYYRRFVPQFSKLTASLSDLTRASGTKKIVWTEQCESSFKEIQRVLSSGPVLRLPSLSEEFVVRTDASNTGLGAVLLQKCEGVLHPVVFVSRKLLDRETRYSTIERECLAIVWALTKLSRYLWGHRFVLQTDHKPLTFLNSGQFKNGRLTRWALSLQEYCFDIVSLPGRDNVFADCLSRSGVSTEVP
eukprot:TRINITY_DN1145_c0_g1_i6.p1 TRINITY_DN1145_c0_g1~~TRINITY_DN1145_c0_g1_i6.p1  ORF type:complete len:1434 (+),score=199.20 TRINITY_DN1145_c0_g1_i6:329-4630(+)